MSASQQKRNKELHAQIDSLERQLSGVRAEVAAYKADLESHKAASVGELYTRLRDGQKQMCERAERAEASALDWQQRFESDMDGDIAEQLAERDGLESERDHYRVAAAKERDRAERAEAEAAAANERARKADQYRDDMVASIKQAKAERDRYQRAAVVASMPLSDVWLWSGKREELDSEGVSLVCPVVMEADTLRSLLAEASALREQRAGDLAALDSMATDAQRYEEKRDAEAKALLAEVERLRATVTELQSQRDNVLDAHSEGAWMARALDAEREEKAQKARAEAAEADVARLKIEKQWVVDRITADLKAEGIELLWTDGGGSACPSGWHRNPYINSGLRKRIEALEAALRPLVATVEFGDKYSLGTITTCPLCEKPEEKCVCEGRAARALLSAPATPLADDYSTDALLSAPAQCCERDIDGYGNCDRHPAKEVKP